jgi:hypothetical protein
MPGKFLHLDLGAKEDLSQYFAGPWSKIERKLISSDQSDCLTQTDVEVATYVISGGGELEVNGRAFELTPGSAAMLLKDSTEYFRAKTEMELLLVTVQATAS